MADGYGSTLQVAMPSRKFELILCTQIEHRKSFVDFEVVNVTDHQADPCQQLAHNGHGAEAVKRGGVPVELIAQHNCQRAQSATFGCRAPARI